VEGLMLGLIEGETERLKLGLSEGDNEGETEALTSVIISH